MMDQDIYWQEQIHKVMPDLEIRDLTLHEEGLVNAVLIVNDKWVVRFTKTDWGKELMDMEYRLLRYLQPKLTLSIPMPEKHDDDVMIYPLLPGESFVQSTWLRGTFEQQQSIADQLGEFLNQIHNIRTQDLDWEIPPTLAAVGRETWIDIYDRLVEKIYPILLQYQIDWIESLFEPALNKEDYFDFEPALIHGDLVPYHILYEPESGKLNAVIDFGMAGMGDPAADLGTLINNYGESLVEKLSKTYQGYEKQIERARFYAQAIELHWTLLGVESGQNYWFTTHLGGARDIRFIGEYT